MVNPLLNYSKIYKMAKQITKNWKILLILVLATFLRLWNLGENPPHLTPDEASLGYNAYSILKTGRDEYGKLLPVIFKSFGDYKPGLYVYLAVPFVATFGLTEFSIRLPSALAGIVAVYLLYKIVNILFEKKEQQFLPLISAFVLATNPWHIHFSRGAWEVNLALFFTLAGIYYFLKSLANSRARKFLVAGVTFFALTLLTYQGAKMATALVVLILVGLFWKNVKGWLNVKESRKIVIKGLLVGAIICLPIVLSLFNGKTGRLGVFSVFSNERPDNYIQDFINESGVKKNSLTYYLFYSEALNHTRGILGRLFNHFSGRFLFFEGDWSNPRHTAPNHGVLLVADIIFLVSGIYYLIRHGKSRGNVFVWLWLILGTLPSILSRDQVHAVRSFNVVIPLTIVIASGIVSLFNWLNTHNFMFKTLGKLAMVGVYCVSFAYFIDAYFIHLPKHDSEYWNYGYKQVFEAIKNSQTKYKKIVVEQSFAQPYIYFLFYDKYSPAEYQKQAILVASEYEKDVGYVEKIDNIEFNVIDWQALRNESGTLVVADPVSLLANKSEYKLVKEIQYLNGIDTAFQIVEIQ